MFVHDYPAAASLRRALLAIRGQAYPSSVGLSPADTRQLLVRVEQALEDLEQLENIECTTENPPQVRAGVIVVELEISEHYADALGRFIPYLNKLQLLASGRAMTDAGAAQRIVQDILDRVKLAREKAQEQEVDRG